MKTTPIISVILPCYNVEKYIGKCISSILKQTYSNFEIICINDCSTDNTLQIINAIASKDIRIRIINLEQNKGSANARKLGIDNAKGKYIAFIDSDDYISSDYLLNLYNATSNETMDIVISSGYYQCFKYALRLQCKTTHPSLIDKTFNKDIDSLYPNCFGKSGSYALSPCMKLYRKSILTNIPNIDVFYQDDILLNIYALNNASNIYFLDYIGYYYRTGGWSGRNPNYMIDMKKVYQTKKEILSNMDLSDKDLIYFIIIELKNCFYEYVIRLILNKTSKKQLAESVSTELNDSIYSDFNILKEYKTEIFKSSEYQSILNKSIDEIINIAKSKISTKRKITHSLSLLLKY